MKIQAFRSVTLCILVLTGITGCGKKQDATAPASPNPAPPAQASGTAPGAPQTNQAISPIADPASPLYGWLKYASPDHQFTVIFPALPEEKQKSQESPQGEIQVHIYASEDNAHNGYSVAGYDFPAIQDPKMLLAKIEEGMIKGQDATVDSYKPIQVGDYSGTEFIFTAGGKANFSGRCKLILVGQRAYALSVLYL